MDLKGIFCTKQKKQINVLHIVIPFYFEHSHGSK
jgi:hypothetical protein